MSSDPWLSLPVKHEPGNGGQLCMWIGGSSSWIRFRVSPVHTVSKGRFIPRAEEAPALLLPGNRCLALAAAF